MLHLLHLHLFDVIRQQITILFERQSLHLGRFLILFFFFSVARFVALLVWALVLQMRPLVCHSWQKNRPAP